jgi:hypothetical protein
VQLEDVPPQVVLEPERSTDQETSKPPEKVITDNLIHAALVQSRDHSPLSLFYLLLLADTAFQSLFSSWFVC